jgi:multiple sugar transport system substrate-binding protein
MSRLLRKLTIPLSVALLAAACTAGAGSQASAPPSINPSTSHAPVTITFWTGWSSREFRGLEQIIKGFEAKYPWITVNSTPGIDDDAKILAAINGGNPPDAVSSFRPDYVGKYCSTGGFLDLGPYMKASDVKTSIFPPSVLSYVQYKGEICALPFLTDTFGLYYNKDLLAPAFTEPPKTISELTDMAKKLTQFNGDGSIKVAGFIPTIGNFYENDLDRFAVAWNAKWLDDSGKSAFSTDPAWAELFQWQKSLVDWYGYKKLTKFLAGVADNEWDTGNAFETGKVAMILDGEWRTAFMADEAPKINYGTAPFPAADNHPEMYGAQVVGGTIVGIPRGSQHPAEAWLLINYLATNTDALVQFANLIKNVPTTYDALKSPNLDLGPNFTTFLQAFQHPKSGFPPQTSAGIIGDIQGVLFADKWQAGKVPDLMAGLRALDTQVNDQISLGGG